MKQALLITYYWPPAGGPGVHRWLRFSKYFKRNGWQLTVFCPEDAEWPVVDSELEKQVSTDLNILRFPIWEPHKYLGKKSNPNKAGGFTRTETPSLKTRFITWVRGNMFIPDARKFWIKPSIRYLSRYLAEHPEIEAVITTGPPHSLHLIGLGLKKSLGIRWLADFRDPWTQIDFYHELFIGKRADAIHHRMEKEVLQQADEVVTISEAVAAGLEQIATRPVTVITNGYEFVDFDARSIVPDTRFSIAHIGSMAESRNPRVLWEALKVLLVKEPGLAHDLEVRLIGPVDHSVFADVQKSGLVKFVRHTPQVSHAESLDMQRKMALLLLVVNNTGISMGTLTGKFFEYLGARRPILAIGPKQGDLEEALRATGAGSFVGYDEVEKAVETIRRYYEAWKQGELYVEAKALEKYDSAALARRYCERLDLLITKDK